MALNVASLVSSTIFNVVMSACLCYQDKGRVSSGQPSSSGPTVSVNSSSSLPPVCAAAVPNGHMAPPTSSPNFPVRPQLPLPSESP